MMIDQKLLYRFFTEDLAPERDRDPKFNESVINLINSLQALVFSDEWREKAIPLLQVLREVRRDKLEAKTRSEKERDNLCGEIDLIKFIIDLQEFIDQGKSLEREPNHAG